MDDEYDLDISSIIQANSSSSSSSSLSLTARLKAIARDHVEFRYLYDALPQKCKDLADRALINHIDYILGERSTMGVVNKEGMELSEGFDKMLGGAVTDYMDYFMCFKYITYQLLSMEMMDCMFAEMFGYRSHASLYYLQSYNLSRNIYGGVLISNESQLDTAFEEIEMHDIRYKTYLLRYIDLIKAYYAGNVFTVVNIYRRGWKTKFNELYDNFLGKHDEYVGLMLGLVHFMECLNIIDEVLDMGFYDKVTDIVVKYGCNRLISKAQRTEIKGDELYVIFVERSKITKAYKYINVIPDLDNDVRNKIVSNEKGRKHINAMIEGMDNAAFASSDSKRMRKFDDVRQRKRIDDIKTATGMIDQKIDELMTQRNILAKKYMRITGTSMQPYQYMSEYGASVSATSLGVTSFDALDDADDNLEIYEEGIDQATRPVQIAQTDEYDDSTFPLSFDDED